MNGGRIEEGETGREGLRVRGKSRKKRKDAVGKVKKEERSEDLKTKEGEGEKKKMFRRRRGKN